MHWLAINFDVGIGHSGHIFDDARRICDMREGAVGQVDGPYVVTWYPCPDESIGCSVNSHVVDVDVVEGWREATITSRVVKSSEEGCSRDAGGSHAIHVDILDESPFLRIGF